MRNYRIGANAPAVKSRLVIRKRTRYIVDENLLGRGSYYRHGNTGILIYFVSGCVLTLMFLTWLLSAAIL